MAGLLIRNIGTLAGIEEKGRKVLKGKEMQEVNCISNAFLLMENGKIKDYGSMKDVPNFMGQTLNATGKIVSPCWCDSHTHLVYAASREAEYVDRIKGLSYEEIAANGGGILNSARKMQDAPEDELLEAAYLRLGEIKDMGTGAVEIKSGYGLSTDAELKMLRVIRKLQSITELEIKSTFLGAHAIPLEYKENREGYIKLLIEDMLPKIADENLADYIDVFCDRGFFTPDETSRILEAGAKYGLKAKIHANELGATGGIQVGVKHGAISVDHCEHTGPDELAALASGDTIPSLLPGTAFFLGIEYPPARDIIDYGLPIALASDYNPGSCPSGKMQFVMTLACNKMRLLPEEAFNAATLNGAAAMELSDRLGSITKGKDANVFITKKAESLAHLPYYFGSDLIETVIIKGVRQ